VEKHDIVQLHPEKTLNPHFAGCFMVVTEVKDWGVQGYCQNVGGAGGMFYYRAGPDEYERTGGKAVWVAD